MCIEKLYQYWLNNKNNKPDPVETEQAYNAWNSAAAEMDEAQKDNLWCATASYADTVAGQAFAAGLKLGFSFAAELAAH